MAKHDSRRSGAGNPPTIALAVEAMSHVVRSSLLAILAGLVVTSIAHAEGGAPLAPADVIRIMAGRRPAIRAACYDGTPKAEVSLRIDFVVGATGTVTDARANDAKGSAETVDCVLREVRRTIFPSSDKGGAFQWPFVFKGP
ncbi:MAG: hypothetical protein ACHREM_06315 [Polyangiales bacterium]